MKNEEQNKKCNPNGCRFCGPSIEQIKQRGEVAEMRAAITELDQQLNAAHFRIAALKQELGRREQ